MLKKNKINQKILKINEINQHILKKNDIFQNPISLYGHCSKNFVFFPKKSTFLTNLLKLLLILLKNASKK